MTPRILPLGDAAWTVEFGDTVDMATHARVMGFARALEFARSERGLDGVIEWVPTFRSLTVHFDPLAVDADQLACRLTQIAANSDDAVASGRRWRIPVLFGGDAGPDLPDLVSASGLTQVAVIERLAATVFRVFMLGFMPGFPYMGGLPAELSMPRLATPRKLVPARTLAVAGTMCAIYPWDSPGGWRLLGRTPVSLFSPTDSACPALFAPGDEVMWQPIDGATFERMEQDAARGRLDRAQFLVPPEASWPA